MKKQLLTLISALVTVMLFGQPTYPPPSGVYCSCGPTTSTVGAGSVDPNVATKPFVKGILVRIGWKDIEPSDNTYNWALLDNQINAANVFGKKISLAIGGGPNSPSWLYSLGTQTISYTIPFPGTIPVLWNTTFLTKWTEFVRALGNKYKNDTTIRLVYITNATGNGIEMQLPFNPTPSYTSISYTDQKVINSWKQVIDTFKVAFPNHYLSNDFHPVNGSNAVADSVYNYAKLKIPNRYGANAWWWTQNNTTVYPSQYNILQNSASTNIFTGVQMALNATADSATFGAGGLHTALALAISKGVCYWEVWNQDIVNPNLASLLTNSTSCSTIMGVTETKNINENDYFIYPNPSTGKIVISFNNSISKQFDLKIFNQLGSLVHNQIFSNDPLASIDLSNFQTGIYFVYVSGDNREYHPQKLMHNHCTNLHEPLYKLLLSETKNKLVLSEYLYCHNLLLTQHRTTHTNVQRYTYWSFHHGQDQDRLF